MREAAFVKRNQARWQQIEKDLQSNRPDPDRLAEIFIQLTDDLAFARTQYPDSRVTLYLNNLTSKIHHTIYRNKREDQKRFVTFWKYEAPLELWKARRELAYAFAIFVVSIAIGYLSTLNDDTFARLILGDAYVNMTLKTSKPESPWRFTEVPMKATCFCLSHSTTSVFRLWLLPWVCCCRWEPVISFSTTE